jgi:hypothetical protein
VGRWAACTRRSEARCCWRAAHSLGAQRLLQAGLRGPLLLAGRLEHGGHRARQRGHPQPLEGLTQLRRAVGHTRCAGHAATASRAASGAMVAATPHSTSDSARGRWATGGAGSWWPTGTCSRRATAAGSTARNGSGGSTTVPRCGRDGRPRAGRSGPPANWSVRRVARAPAPAGRPALAHRVGGAGRRARRRRRQTHPS